MTDQIIGWFPGIALHQLWLGVLVAAIAWVAVRALRAWTARSRYWLWCCVLAVIALSPLLMVVPAPVRSSAVAHVEPQAAPAAPSTRAAAAAAAAEERVIPTPRVAPSIAAFLVFAWLVVVGCKLSSLVHGFTILHRWRRAAVPVHVDSTVEVLESEDVRTPMVVGVLRPCVLLPVGLRQQLTSEQLALVLAHERAHISRADPAIALIQRLIAIVYFYNPVIHWVARHIERERECSCDDMAVASEHDRECYAGSLIAVARHVAGGAPLPEAAIGAIGQPSELGHRIERLLENREHESWRSRVATGGTTAVVIAAVVLLSPVVPLAHAENAASASRDDSPRMTWSTGSRRSARALLQAAEDGDVDSVRALAQSGADINAPVIGDGTPLIVAARKGNEKLVQALLELGANVNAPSRGDGNPLIRASARGDLDIVKLLVEHGANVNAYVPGDETPLINAARAGKMDVVDYLASHGANVRLAVPADDSPDSEIRSPLGEARKHGRTAVIQRLIELEAQQTGGR